MEYMKANGPEFWSMLDKMASTDPDAYKEYIRGQMEADLANRTGRRIIMPTPAYCVKAVIAAVTPAGTATAAVKAAAAAGVQLPPRKPLHADVKPTQPLFVNVCSHDAVAAPTGPTGSSVLDGEKGRKAGGPPPKDLPLDQLLNLQVPIIVGVVRPIRGTGACVLLPAGRVGASNAQCRPSSACAARTEWAVDVLVHPWVVRAATRQPAFASEFSAFAARCAADELGVEFAGDGPARVDKFDYAGGNPKVGGGGGGSGGRAEEPVGFDVTAHLASASAATAVSSSSAAAARPAPVAPPLAPAPAPAPTPAILELGPGRGSSVAAAAAAGLFPVPPGGGGSRGGQQAAAAAGASGGSLPGGVLRLPGGSQQGGSAGAGVAAAAAAGPPRTSAPADVLREVRGRKAGGDAAAAIAPAAPASLERTPAATAAAAPARPPVLRADGPRPAAAVPGIRLSPASEARAVLAPDGSGRVTATITFDADVVNAAALRMHLVDLDVEPDALTLTVQPAALQAAGAAGVDPIVRLRLPCVIDPESASASYSRASRTLTVTASATSPA